MNPDTTATDAAAILAVARGARAAANAAEAQVLASAVEWAHLHVVDDLDDAATLLVQHGRDTGIPIAGEGAPLVSEFAVLDFAAALGLSADPGRVLVGQALELADRLPRVWARVQDGNLPAWRAKRIAEQTTILSPEAAAFVDAQVAPFAHKTGPAQTQRLVEEAIARFMPDYAAQQRDRAAEQRYFTIDHDQVSFAGTSRVHGELDLADALDLEDAIRAGAEQLKTLGNDESLDVRRSLAVGMLARGEQALELVSTGSTTEDGSTTGVVSTGSTTDGGRDIVLYVHLSEDALRSGDADAPAWVDNAGGHLLTTAQIATWCGRADTRKVTVKPVIDLNQPRQTHSYRPTEQMAEEIRLRDRTCVFPLCHRPAASCQIDHISPWDQGGATATWNLALLCVKHHRLKTHGRWTYTMTAPGVFLWRSPLGYRYQRDRTGTTDLTPHPGDPPERRAS